MPTTSTAFVWPGIFLSAVLLLACAPPVPEIPGFSPAAWTADPQGCTGKRMELAAALKAGIPLLLAQPEPGIMAVLGKPERVELYKRNQKLFHYYLSGGPACPAGDSTTEVVVRFNAMGRAKEILLP